MSKVIASRVSRSFVAAADERVRRGQEPEPLAPDEVRAIASLKRLAKRWPKTLWLFCGSGYVSVLKTWPKGQRMSTSSGGTDPAFKVASIDIPKDGGDW